MDVTGKFIQSFAETKKETTRSKYAKNKTHRNPVHKITVQKYIYRYNENQRFLDKNKSVWGFYEINLWIFRLIHYSVAYTSKYHKTKMAVKLSNIYNMQLLNEALRKKKSFLYHLNQMRPNIDYIIVLGCCSIWLQYIGTTFKNFGLKLK